MFNWFKKKEVQEKPRNNLVVQFIVNSEGEVEIDIRWAEETTSHAAGLGRMLYVINSGGFKEDIVNLLATQAKDYESSKPFIGGVFAQWASLTKQEIEAQEEADNEPIIPPDNFLSGNKRTQEDES